MSRPSYNIHRWLRKRFLSAAAQNKWCAEHRHQFQITPLFVNNGYAVEFRKLRQL